MYRILKLFLFRLDPEQAHHFTFKWLKIIASNRLIKSLLRSFYSSNDRRLEKTVTGLKFRNPVGLAAGLDKDAGFYNELSCFGFGFIEIGTITPLPQPGNDQPRLFRLIKDEALINRMGFNNAGVDAAVERLKKRKTDCIIGGNIGKNKVTPNERAFDDYKICFEKLFDWVDYFVVNVSSPNTPGLRELQDKEPLKRIISGLHLINLTKSNPKPIFLKIAPDLSNNQLDEIIEIILETKIAGIVATNTTIDRSNLSGSPEELNKIGSGGLSGRPLTKRSTEVIKYISEKSGKAFPIIGVGGIHSADDAVEKLNAGADLIQLYTGFIYEGPSLVKKINHKIIS